MKLKRALSLLLAGLMLTGSLAACATETDSPADTSLEETTAAPETAPELSVSEVSEAQEVSAPTDDKSSAIEPPMTMSTKKKSNAPLIIGGIIAVIAVGAAAFILGKRSKK